MADPHELEGMGAAEAILQVGPDVEPDAFLLDDSTFPGPIAEAMYWSDAAVVGIQGPVGSGKTTTVLKSRRRRAITMPRSTVDGVRRYKLLVIRETYRQLWSTTIPSYLEVFPKRLGEWSGGRGDPVRHVMPFEDEFGPIEFVTEFLAFGDDIVASMRGVQTCDIWLNETDTLPDDVLTVGIGRINRWPAREHMAGYPPELQSYGQIVCDFNAPDEDNWTYGVFHDDAARARISAEMSRELPPGARAIRIEFYRQPGFGEPGAENLHNLAPGYYETQIATMKLAGRGDMIERLVRNRTTYIRVGEPVFVREWNRAVHVSDRLDPWPDEPLRIGLDQGFKGAAVIGQFRPPMHWRVLAELHFPKERLMAAAFGERLAELLSSDRRLADLPVEAAWGDMAGEHGASQAATENMTWNRIVGDTVGITVRPQKIGTNRIQPRLEAVRAALEFLHAGQPGMLVDRTCRYLIAGMEARYVWADEVDASGDKRKRPDKRQTEANVVDALQYLLLSEARGDGLSHVSGPSAATPRSRPFPGRDARAELTTAFDVVDPYGAA